MSTESPIPGARLQPSASYSFTMRLHLPQQGGAFARVAQAIAEAEAMLGAIESLLSAVIADGMAGLRALIVPASERRARQLRALPDGRDRQATQAQRVAEEIWNALAEAVELGEEATVLRIPDGDAGLLRYLAELTILPGRKVTMRRSEPFGGPLTVDVDGSEHAISRELAGQIGVSG